MKNTLRNARYYRKQDVKVGDMVTPEKFHHIGRFKDVNGNLVDVDGTLELWGNVVSINNDYHCSVRCTELRFNRGNVIIPIKKENQFVTSINFHLGNKRPRETFS